MAVNTIVEYKEKLNSEAFSERNEAEKWFSGIILQFHRSKIDALNLYHLQDDAFQKTNKS